MRTACLACILLLAHAIAAQAETFPDISHLAFATLSDSSKLTVIDIDKDQVVGGVELGLKPSQIEISLASPVLAATDGRSSRVVLADLAAGRTSDIALSFPARRLLTSPDGQKLAVSDLTGGHVAVFSLPDGRALANLSGLPALSDLLFAGDGSALFIASNDLDGLGVIDIAQGKVTAKISPEPDAARQISRITRSANGRLIFARSEKSGLIGVIDLRAGKPLPSIQAGSGIVTATPSGSGAYLLLTNESKRSFSIVHGDDLSPGVELAAAPGLGETYTGWFDSVAFVPSTNKRTLLVYDLWRMSKGGDISLPAVPGPGTVTADGAKLYLPLEDKSAIAVIDARNRRLSSVIALDGHPTGIAVGAGYGICH